MCVWVCACVWMCSARRWKRVPPLSFSPFVLSWGAHRKVRSTSFTTAPDRCADRIVSLTAGKHYDHYPRRPQPATTTDTPAEPHNTVCIRDYDDPVALMTTWTSPNLLLPEPPVEAFAALAVTEDKKEEEHNAGT